MICKNPTQLEIDGKMFDIRYDVFSILDILCMFNNPELTDEEKVMIMLIVMYPEHEEIQDIEQAVLKAKWFIDCGNDYEADSKPSLMDWEQDFNLIIPSVNEVLGYDVCDDNRNVHWWTFVRGYMQIFQRENNLFASVTNVRDKLKKHKKLEKYEKEFYKENKQIIDLKAKITKEEQEFINQLTGGG